MINAYLSDRYRMRGTGVIVMSVLALIGYCSESALWSRRRRTLGDGSRGDVLSLDGHVVTFCAPPSVPHHRRQVDEIRIAVLQHRRRLRHRTSVSFTMLVDPPNHRRADLALTLRRLTTWLPSNVAPVRLDLIGSGRAMRPVTIATNRRVD